MILQSYVDGALFLVVLGSRWVLSFCLPRHSLKRPTTLYKHGILLYFHNITPTNIWESGPVETYVSPV